MATLTPVAEFLDRGVGTNDLSGQLVAAADLSNDFRILIQRFLTPALGNGP